MRPPCEVVQTDFLPAVRSRLAVLLRERGLSQVEIADRMNITQAAVSKYLRQEVQDTPLTRRAAALASRLAEAIMTGGHSAEALVHMVCKECMVARIRSDICALHRERLPVLDDLDCQVCTHLLGGTEPGLQDRSRVLDDLSSALRLLEGDTGFAALVPQVRANLVACGASAQSVDDVAGVPGRITVVGGRARALVGPQFGASRHTAGLLLWAKSVWPPSRACLCISGRPEVVRCAEDAGVDVVRLPRPAVEVGEIVGHMSDRTWSSGDDERPRGLHVPGGVGVEPVLYIFGTTATGLARLAVQIASAVRSAGGQD